MPHWTVCPATGTQWTEGNEKQAPDGSGSLIFHWTWQQDTATSGGDAALCNGPTVSVTIQNSSDLRMYASLPNTNSGARQVAVDAGYSRTTSNPTQLAALGLSTRSDCGGIQLSSIRDLNLTLVVAP